MRRLFHYTWQGGILKEEKGKKQSEKTTRRNGYFHGGLLV
jgi:hypothetical protein